MISIKVINLEEFLRSSIGKSAMIDAIAECLLLICY